VKTIKKKERGKKDSLSLPVHGKASEELALGVKKRTCLSKLSEGVCSFCTKVTWSSFGVTAGGFLFWFFLLYL
jgi:archaellum component FlaD/FlaE